MRIVGISSAISSRRATVSRRRRPADAARKAGQRPDRGRGPGRASAPRAVTRYPAAPFVAHLIATRMQVPQTRARRRAEPDEAIAVYRSMTKPVPCIGAFGTRA